jgi:phosphate transport system protein
VPDEADKTPIETRTALGTGQHAFKAQEDLWADVLKLAKVVESVFGASVCILRDRRPELAADVKAGELEIDRQEVAIENGCLRVLALYEPVASDLRRVLTVFRVNRDLERIGDLAVRIAKRAKKLDPDRNPFAVCAPLQELAAAATQAVEAALDSLARCDTDLGRSIIYQDRRLNDYWRDVQTEMKHAIRHDVDRLDDYLRLMDIARHFERAGDHAKGIAESVFYLKEGQIIRHTRMR